MAEKLAIKRYHKMVNTAALTIQKYRKQIKLKNLEKQKAALMIQTLWRNKKSKKLSPRNKLEIETKAALVIQRQYRLYQQRKKVTIEDCFQKINELAVYFDKLRESLYTNSQIKIAYYYRRHLRKRESLAESKKRAYKNKKYTNKFESMFTVSEYSPSRAPTIVNTGSKDINALSFKKSTNRSFPKSESFIHSRTIKKPNHKGNKSKKSKLSPQRAH